MSLVKKISFLLIIILYFIFPLHSFNNTVIVNPDGNICQSEIDYIKKREPIALQALEKLLQKKLSQYKKISLCYSGGGYRSMICNLGFILGAAKIGLSPATVYDSSLSGSTWTRIPMFIRKIFQQENLTRHAQLIQSEQHRENTKKSSGFFAHTWSYFTGLTTPHR